MKVFLIIIICAIGNYCAAQHTISGTITDLKKIPLRDVSVFIPEFQKYDLSKEDGTYLLKNVGIGIVTIQFSKIGYKTVIKTINTGDSSNVVNAEMEPTSMELEEVLVTSNYAKLTDNIPFPTNSVSQQEIRKYAAPSVMSNLSYQPGIDRISIGNGIGKPVIRGLSFNRIMLYGQGTRIENQQWDDHHDLGLSDVGIETVELVRGPAALIYGADALGGALIFVDEKPAVPGTTVGDANLGFASNTLGINADAGVKGANNNGLFYGIRVSGQSHTSYVQGEGDEIVKKPGETEDFAANSKFNNALAKANIGVSKKWGSSKLSYSYLKQQIGIIENESADTAASKGENDQRDRDMEAPYQEVATQIVSSENTILTGKSKLNINLAYQVNDRKEFEPTVDSNGIKGQRLAIGLKLNTTTYDMKWTSNQEKNFGVTIGSQGTFLKNTNNGEESLVPDANVNDVAGYGLVRYDYGKLNLLGGIRYDSRHIETHTYESGATATDSFIVVHAASTLRDTINPKPSTDFTKDYTPVSFSLGAAYHLSEGFTLKLNGATGFSAPNYAELATFGQHEGTFRFERGDRNLKVEQNIEGDLGMIWENEFITVSLGTYINKVKNYIYIANTGDTMVMITDAIDTLPLYDYKQGDATLTGGELGLDIHPKSAKWFDFKATYSLIKGTLDAGGNLPYIPSNKLISEIKLSRDKIGKFTDTYFSVVVSNYAKQNNIAAYELSTDGYTLVDVHIGTGFKIGKQKALFDIYCTNLLNTGYYNQLSLVKYIGVREMGRNIGVQVHVPFGIK